MRPLFDERGRPRLAFRQNCYFLEVLLLPALHCCEEGSGFPPDFEYDESEFPQRS
ncbi:MAG: hypothetical protein ABW252_06830 [Polyangiales bacterium]